MSFVLPSKDAKLAQKMLEVKELVAQSSDSFVSISGNNVTVSFSDGEMSGGVVSVVQIDDSGPTAIAIAKSGIDDTTNSDEIVITLAAPLAANDSLIIKYKS